MKCETCKNRSCICHSCLLNDRCRKATEQCQERDDCPVGYYTTPANAWVPMEGGPQ